MNKFCSFTKSGTHPKKLFSGNLCFLALTFLSPAGWAELPIRDLSGSKTLGYYERKVEKDEQGRVKFIQTQYFNPSKDLLVVEQAAFDSGEVKLYEIDHKQTAQKGVIRFTSDLVTYEKMDEKGHTKTAREKTEGLTLAPLALVPFMESQLEKLRKGETLEFRIAVWDRMESVGMRLKMHKAPSTQDPSLTLKMEPSSFLIRQLVNPFYFFVNSEGRVTKVQGRLAFKEVSGNKLKDIEGLLPILE
ncbi:MAG: hypothetical protein N2Z70_00330 [Bdellovibrionaceae bacterium]|nr:hypothetical protein [Pseudobdellovibrionaceae bacterium]